MPRFPIEKVRGEFPALASGAVFLDNPGGTQVPRRVIDSISDAMVSAASNLGGHFQASREADRINEQGHAAAAALLGGLSGLEIVIGQSMTSKLIHGRPRAPSTVDSIRRAIWKAQSK